MRPGYTRAWCWGIEFEGSGRCQWGSSPIGCGGVDARWGLGAPTLAPSLVCRGCVARWVESEGSAGAVFERTAAGGLLGTALPLEVTGAVDVAGAGAGAEGGAAGGVGAGQQVQRRASLLLGTPWASSAARASGLSRAAQAL